MRKPERLGSARAGLRIALALGGLMVTLVAANPPRVAAGAGAGVEASPVVLPVPANPGQSYALPGLYVVNTGDESSRYVARVERLASARGLDVPSAWISFGRNDVLLAPGQWTILPLSLTVPSAAAVGHYASDLIVATAGDTAQGGTIVGAAAATGLEFSVAEPGVRIDPAWLVAVLVAVMSVPLLASWRRRRIRVRLERP